ncbi:MAG: response regulator [Flavobacterium sp.]|nr:response regulator [Flavobacterium sp.]
MKNLHILIAEDDPDDGEIMLEIFSQHGSYTQINLVKNGLELLQYLSQGTEMPDVILTDINMPIMSGIEALEKLHESDNLSSIPTIVYSSTLNPAYQIKCMNLGTKGFLVKPLKMTDYKKIPVTILEILAGQK